MIDLEQNNSDNVIDVNMGECVVLDANSPKYLITTGLGPCVGVAIVITTINGEVHRLLGHITMEETGTQSFTELKECIKKIREKTDNTTIMNKEISFTTSCSYKNRMHLTEDEIKLSRIIWNAFKVPFRSIKFNYCEQVQISPDGVISNEIDLNNKNVMK